MTLKHKAISGTRWALIAQVGRQLLQIVALGVLARLLAPADFGLMSMVVIVTGLGLLFSDLGTVAAIVQRKDLTDELVSSVFWFNLVIGLCITLLVFFTAPLVALFYQEPRVTPLLQVASLMFVFGSLGAAQKALLQRNLRFRWMAIADMVGTVVSAIVAVGLALAGAGVWSLVAQALVNALMLSLLFWGGTDWRPQWVFRWREVWSISSYSLSLTGVIISNYVVRNADYVLVGRFLGPQPLGYYTIAYRLMLLPLHNFTYVIGRVFFPTFSQIQDDNPRIARIYVQVIGTIALVTFPLMAGLMVVAEPFVLTVFGAEWQPVVWLLVILAPVGLLQSIGATTGMIFQSKGRTDLQFRWALTRGAITIVAFMIGLQWGIMGVAVAYAIVVGLLIYPQLYIALRLIDMRPRALLPALWRPFVSSLLMLAVVGWVRLMLPADMSSVWELAITVPIGVLVYGLASWSINREPLQELVAAMGMKL